MPKLALGVVRRLRLRAPDVVLGLPLPAESRIMLLVPLARAAAAASAELAMSDSVLQLPPAELPEGSRLLLPPGPIAFRPLLSGPLGRSPLMGLRAPLSPPEVLTESRQAPLPRLPALPQEALPPETTEPRPPPRPASRLKVLLGWLLPAPPVPALVLLCVWTLT